MTMTPRVRLYLGIWGLLFLLTMAEVLLTKTGLGRTTILSGLVAMSALKAAAVAAFYMHLRWERIWLTALALTPFVFTTLFAVVLILENGR